MQVGFNSEGFIDIHCHGAVGVDVNEADADGLLRVSAFLARNGVVGWLPTLVPDSDETYRRVIGEIDRAMDMQRELPVAQILGVHYEGVFANEKMCGALRPEFFKPFTGKELDELPRLKAGVHMTTFAPEVSGGVALAGELEKQGWVGSIGHTKADIATLDQAFDAGARHMTHFFNAMSGVHHRDVGVAGWGLTKDGVTFDIIADGVHVEPRMAAMACRCKGVDNVSLISDSVAPTGLGDGQFQLWGETISVVNGRTQNERGSIAGSVGTMHDEVKILLAQGFELAEIDQMAAKSPRKLLGIDGSSVKDSSIVLNENGDLIQVTINGKEVEL